MLIKRIGTGVKCQCVREDGVGKGRYIFWYYDQQWSMGYDMDIYARGRLSLWVMSGMYCLTVVVQVEVCWM
jgi:hypothetical protein